MRIIAGSNQDTCPTHWWKWSSANSRPLPIRVWYLTLTIQQNGKFQEELKNYIAEHGLEEAKTALEEEDKDSQSKLLVKSWFLVSKTTLLSETELKLSSYDSQVLNVKRQASEYLKKCWLGKSTKNRTRRVYRKSSCKWCDCPVKKS